MTTPLSAATHVGIAAPSPFFDKQKMCRHAVLFQLIRFSDLKPHVYRGLIYILYKHNRNDSNATHCRHSCRNLRTKPTFTVTNPIFAYLVARCIMSRIIKVRNFCRDLGGVTPTKIETSGPIFVSSSPLLGQFTLSISVFLRS